MCSIETVRRVARGDTYRHVAGIKAHPSYGGLHAVSPAGLRPAVGSQSPQAAPQPTLATFIPPASLPSLADTPGLADEPADDEAAASLARLQASLAMPVPGDTQASRAATLLDELEAAGKAQRPSQGGAKLDAELG